MLCKLMLYPKVIFKSMTGPNNTGQKNEIFPTIKSLNNYLNTFTMIWIKFTILSIKEFQNLLSIHLHISFQWLFGFFNFIVIFTPCKWIDMLTGSQVLCIYIYMARLSELFVLIRAAQGWAPILKIS